MLLLSTSESWICIKSAWFRLADWLMGVRWTTLEMPPGDPTALRERWGRGSTVVRAALRPPTGLSAVR